MSYQLAPKPLQEIAELLYEYGYIDDPNFGESTKVRGACQLDKKYYTRKAVKDIAAKMEFAEFNLKYGSMPTYFDMGFEDAVDGDAPKLSGQELIEIADGENLKNYLYDICQYLENKKNEGPAFDEAEYIEGWVLGCVFRIIEFWEDIDVKLSAILKNSPISDK